jgi:threonine synthase
MRYLSTAGIAPPVGFREALLAGIAPDGGLYLPESIPRLEPEVLRSLDADDLPRSAVAVMAPFVADAVGPDALLDLVRDALDFPIPLVAVADGIHILELFHGPTLAFKDVAARTMARLMARLREPDRPLTVLVATSGDTGSAVAHAFWGLDGVKVVVLYPAGKVSRLQEQQFTTLGGNVTAVAVAGTFDDCQRLVKRAFANRQLSTACGLTSANSINIGRLLPQMVYWVHGLLQLGLDSKPPVWCVPSGNFGNLTAGLMAWKAGLAATGFEAATNRNDVVPEYLATGMYRPRPAVATISNAMDVGDPSNVARVRALFGDDLERLRDVVSATAWSDDATRRAMAEVYERTGRILDPHTAVGWLALQSRRERGGHDIPGVLLATAHPAKFGDAVEAAIGMAAPLPERLASCLEREPLSLSIAADEEALFELLTSLDRE